MNTSATVNQLNPKNIIRGSIITIPGGRGHNRGYFYVEEVNEIKANSNYDGRIRHGWYYRNRDFVEVICVRVAWEDGRPSKGKKKMAFVATDCHVVTKQKVIEEFDAAVNLAKEKRDCIIELIDKLEH